MNQNKGKLKIFGVLFNFLLNFFIFILASILCLIAKIIFLIKYKIEDDKTVREYIKKHFGVDDNESIKNI